MNIEFAYWVPNVSGGLVTSHIPQRTHWGFDYNKRLALTAEAAGFDHALAQARFFASYGADKQLEAVTTAVALAAVTTRLNLIAAVHPGLWHPAVIANVIASANVISNGRVSLNVVSGWFKDEYTGFGAEWLEHDERYVRSEEFIRVLKGMWTEERFSLDGKYYQITDVPCEPKPASRPHPTVFQGGNSPAAREMAARVTDVMFINGGSVESIKGIIEDVRERARKYGREDQIRFAMNAFVIERDTEREAEEHPARDRLAGERRGGEGLRRGGEGGGPGLSRGDRDVVGLVVRGPRPVQRRLQAPAHRHGGSDRRADRALRGGRGGHPAHRLPPLHRGGRALRLERDPPGAGDAEPPP